MAETFYIVHPLNGVKHPTADKPLSTCSVAVGPLYKDAPDSEALKQYELKFGIIPGSLDLADFRIEPSVKPPFVDGYFDSTEVPEVKSEAFGRFKEFS